MREQPIDPELRLRLESDPQFQALLVRRGRFRWGLTVLMLAAYFGYIGLIAFDKSILAHPIGGGAMSVGIPVGIALIVFTVALTGIYVARSNREFDREIRDIVERATR